MRTDTLAPTVIREIHTIQIRNINNIMDAVIKVVEKSKYDYDQIASMVKSSGSSIHPNTIKKWCNYETTSPRISKINEVLKVLGYRLILERYN